MNEQGQEKSIVHRILIGFVLVLAGYSIGVIHQEHVARNEFEHGVHEAQSEIDSVIWELQQNGDPDGNRDIRIDAFRTLADRFHGKIHGYSDFPSRCEVIQSAVGSEKSNIVICGEMHAAK